MSTVQIEARTVEEIVESLQHVIERTGHGKIEVTVKDGKVVDIIETVRRRGSHG